MALNFKCEKGLFTWVRFNDYPVREYWCKNWEKADIYMKQVIIYTLSDPRNGEIRYIGTAVKYVWKYK